ncbi:hypothetical protein Patl1_00406 [Pistacia atlantica]|uniref:Uncharacterized protein n=1 Tax=Pistacia atlantica TaxID=434234 RepID=A0ACC1C495_9ROSI|nr:hypothetical protein Patl1_00406 [Pistacia atlantica]
MAFTGTLDKCKACDKTVYVVDMLSLEGTPYHKSCFKCSHCKGTLVIALYLANNVLLYDNDVTGKSERNHELSRTPSKLSSLFCGTQDKCAACEKTVYPLEKVTMEGECYHKTCFRCAHGGCPLTHSSYAALDGVLYCKHHFSQLFMEKGNYSHVLKAATHRRNASTTSEPAETKPDEPTGEDNHTEDRTS